MDDFPEQLRHPASLINFLAAYSTDTFIASQSTEALKRCAAYFVVNGSVPTAPYTCPAVLPGTPPNAADRSAILNGSGGLDRVDLWIGGLAEDRGQNAGSSEGILLRFRTQMENGTGRRSARTTYSGSWPDLINALETNTLADRCPFATPPLRICRPTCSPPTVSSST